MCMWNNWKKWIMIKLSYYHYIFVLNNWINWLFVYNFRFDEYVQLQNCELSQLLFRGNSLFSSHFFTKSVSQVSTIYKIISIQHIYQLLLSHSHLSNKSATSQPHISHIQAKSQQVYFQCYWNVRSCQEISLS